MPDDPAECRRFLEDVLRSQDALRRQAEDERRRAEDEQQKAEEIRRRVDELQRILEATAADHDRLKEEHAELAETLALLRRYLFGPRRERRSDDPDQGHLFDLPADPKPGAPDAAADDTAARGPARRALRDVPASSISRTSASNTTSPRPSSAGRGRKREERHIGVRGSMMSRRIRPANVTWASEWPPRRSAPPPGRPRHLPARAGR